MCWKIGVVVNYQLVCFDKLLKWASVLFLATMRIPNRTICIHISYYNYSTPYNLSPRYEMPNLETLNEIMGRRSFPKWWLESIRLRPQRRNALLTSHRPAATNQQQGKRQESAAAPKLHPSRDKIRNSATGNRNIVARVPVEGLSSVVNKFIPRNDGELDMPSCIAVQSGSNEHSSVHGPDGGAIRSSDSGRSGKNNRSPISDSAAVLFAPRFPALVEAKFFRKTLVQVT